MADDDSEMRCDHCGGSTTTSLEDVKTHGPRLVTVCDQCGQATISTEPTPSEQIVTALLAAKQGRA